MDASSSWRVRYSVTSSSPRANRRSRSSRSPASCLSSSTPPATRPEPNSRLTAHSTSPRNVAQKRPIRTHPPTPNCPHYAPANIKVTPSRFHHVPPVSYTHLRAHETVLDL